jgi:hypothetical protein
VAVNRARRRSAGGVAAAALLPALLVIGCAAQRTIPPGPALPEVRFVPPCDPDASIALTAEDEKALVDRDRLLRTRIEQLESMLLED